MTPKSLNQVGKKTSGQTNELNLKGDEKYTSECHEIISDLKIISTCRSVVFSVWPSQLEICLKPKHDNKCTSIQTSLLWRLIHAKNPDLQTMYTSIVNVYFFFKYNHVNILIRIVGC